MTDGDDGGFRAFFEEAEPRLRRALVAMYGSDRGREATAEALAYGWEHWEKKVHRLSNPVGYLFRVGQSRTRPRRWRQVHVRPSTEEPWFEPSLRGALTELSSNQRLAVVLVHGFGWSLRDVAELADIKVTTVQSHLERGLARLRVALKVEDHAEPQ